MFDQHIVMAEFYQYSKPDHNKAVSHVTEAIALIQQSPDLLILNPYVFVDMGNLFNRLGFPEQALEQYRLARKTAQTSQIDHAKALAFHNMALVHQSAHQFDSAAYYLQKAATFITDSFDLMMAVNLTYQAELASAQENHWLAKALADRALQTLENYKNQRFVFLPPPQALLETVTSEFQAKVLMVLCKASEAEGDLPASHCYQQDVFHEMAAAPSRVLAATFWQWLAESAVRRHLPDEYLRQTLDSAFFYTRSLNDYQLLIQHRERLHAMLMASENHRHRVDRLLPALPAATSIQQSHKAAIKLSSVSLLQQLNQLHLASQQADRIIRLHKAVLWLLAIVAFMAGFSMLLMLFKNNQLRLAYTTLAEKVTNEVNQRKKQTGSETGGNDHWRPRLTRLMEERKPYLDKTINLNRLALELGTNQTYLSKLINQHYQLNFSEFINKHRVEEACRLMVEGHLQQLSFDQLADKCGFNSKSTFYAAFKQFTGLTPAQFAKSASAADPPRQGLS